MSINEYIKNTEQPVFYLLTFEITPSLLAIPNGTISVFCSVGHTIKCVTIKIKRKLTAGNGKLPSVLVPQAIFIKLINLSPI